ncbi:hypothetical protein BD410DRAFT_780945 [Rickenella mellea]|uniref:Uncharacterized protein n=1 Tax=Rickenella mellea TaxID=50990 RepID=A0A4Y7QN16_9AGAM|nr:hypothetical protein BD410DRAFT_780945 [Rickenella mellea]
MAEFAQNLDPNNLVLIEAVLSFVVSPFEAPAYNLPIFLFGIYAQENSESTQALRLFTGMLVGSIVFDIIWMIRHSQNWFIKLLSIVILIFKVPTFVAFGSALRQRGEQFAGLGVRGNDLSGPTVWSMPGGFTSLGGSRNGYEPVDGDRDIESQPRQTPSGPNITTTPAVPPPQSTAAGQGGYQTL